MRFLSSGRVRLTALVAVVVGLAAGGIAYASIPDASGVIHGCYKTVNGVLRVIDTDKGGKCVPGETALNWNQTGPKGATGAKGPTGAAGPSFGDGEWVSAAFLPGCTASEVGSIPVTITRPSRIYATGLGVYSPAQDQTAMDLFLQLRDAADTTTLAGSG